MKIMLVHPPLDDPTIPYHSTAYLAGNLVQNGFTDVVLRDLNIEFLTYCLEEAKIQAFYEEADRRVAQLLQRNHLTFAEQEEYFALINSSRIQPRELQQSRNTFRSLNACLDFGLYQQSVNNITAYLEFLGALSYPAENEGIYQQTRGRFSFNNLADLLNRDLGERICFPFGQFFSERLARDPDLAASDMLGISVIYNHQLFHAIYLAATVKTLWPEKRIVLGGTTVSQIYKYLKDKSRITCLSAVCNALVVGEGETAICELAQAKGDLEGRTGLTNTIVFAQDPDRTVFPSKIHYEDLNAVAPPVYAHSWDLYLSPERGINYAPTRGCYWNRCTFCDYGLNTDKPTSPWRERKVDTVVEDMGEACQRWGVKYVYFAVDVMAPAYLERLCDAILAAGLRIRWSAELRMEKIFSKERCEKMARAGCACISFGMESGSQRVLNLIDKGTKVSYMAETMKNFTHAGIPVQLMAFSGFPGETETEKEDTRRFIEQNSPYWSAGGLGIFQLTGTSAVARNPERFGISVVETKNADIARSLVYQKHSADTRTTALAEDYDSSFENTGSVFTPVLRRPWAGGTDTLHSMIYYERYGRTFFRENPPAAATPIEAAIPDPQDLANCLVRLRGRLVSTPLDIETILKHRQLFSAYVDAMNQAPAEPTQEAFEQWQTNIASLASGDTNRYWILLDRSCLPLDQGVYNLLRTADAQRLLVSQLVGIVSAELRQTLLNFLVEIGRQGFISFEMQPGALSTMHNGHSFHLA